jgi:hypothetical protein
MSNNKIDYLSEDPKINDQQFCLISFVSKKNIENAKIDAFKIRGSYDTLEGAQTQAKKLQELDPNFHIFVGRVGMWLPFDPEPSSIKDQHYYEEGLQKLIKGYEENLEKAKVLEEQRKREMRGKAINETGFSKKEESISQGAKIQMLKKAKEEDMKNFEGLDSEPEKINKDIVNNKITENINKLKNIYDEL